MTARERSNPFPGYRRFEVNDRALFFGRDCECKQLLERLRDTRLLTVVGAPEIGKSSLVRAGVIPALADQGWKVALTNPGADPIASLKDALSQIEDLRQAGPSPKPLLIVVDPLDELFRFRVCRAAPDALADETSFVLQLLNLVEDRSLPVRVLITLREEFLGECREHPGLAEAIERERYELRPMNRAALREAIVTSASSARAGVSCALLARLLEPIGGGWYSLAILQHALMRSWEYRETQGSSGDLELGHYEAIGGDEALTRHVAEVRDEIGSPDEFESLLRTLTERLDDGLVVRHPCSMAQIRKGCGTDPGRAEKIVERFRRTDTSFVVPPSPSMSDASTVVDLSYDSFLWTRPVAVARSGDPPVALVTGGEEQPAMSGPFKEGPGSWRIVRRFLWPALLALATLLMSDAVSQFQSRQIASEAVVDVPGPPAETGQCVECPRPNPSFPEIRFLLSRLAAPGQYRLSVQGGSESFALTSLFVAPFGDLDAKCELPWRVEGEASCDFEDPRPSPAPYPDITFVTNVRFGDVNNVNDVNIVEGTCKLPWGLQPEGNSCRFLPTVQGFQQLTVSVTQEGSDTLIRVSNNSSKLTQLDSLWIAPFGDLKDREGCPPFPWWLEPHATKTCRFRDKLPTVRVERVPTPVTGGSDGSTVRVTNSGNSGRVRVECEGRSTLSPGGVLNCLEADCDAPSGVDCWKAHRLAIEGDACAAYGAWLSCATSAPDVHDELRPEVYDSLRSVWHRGLRRGGPGALLEHSTVIDIPACRDPDAPKSHDAVRAIAVGRNGFEMLATGSEDGRVHVFDLRDDGLLGEISGPSTGWPVRSVSWSPDGLWLAAGRYDGTIDVWPIPAGDTWKRSRGSLPPEEDDVETRRAGRAVTALQRLGEGIVRSVGFGERLLAAGGDDGIGIWRRRRDGWPVRLCRSDPRPVTAVAFDRSQTLYFAGPDGIGSWKFAEGSCELVSPDRLDATLPGSDGCRSLASDGERVACATDNGEIRIWDDTTRSPEVVLESGHESEVTSIGFSRNGNRLASAGLDRTVRLWERTGSRWSRRPIVLRDHDLWVWTVAFDEDGQRLFSGGEDQTTRFRWTTSERLAAELACR